MKIIFFGNADFGIPTLDSIFSSSKHTLLSVVTNPDKKAGRGKNNTSTPIKIWATENHVNISEISNLKDPIFLKSLENSNADLFIVIAYRILPNKIFEIPKYGTMNLHASLLPKYRGAAPIQRALLNGEKNTGISTFIINDKVDKGKIILQEKTSISDKDNYSSLYTKLSDMGSNLVLKSIMQLEQGIPLKEQNKKTKYAKKIDKNELKINWNNNALDIINKVRAFSLSPGAYSTFKNKRIKILDADISDLDLRDLNQGDIFINQNQLYVKSNNYAVKINLLKPEGKQIMTSTDFVNGYLTANDNRLKFE